ncbi:hypothetical protein M3629_09100 [Paenibacillus polysaccharolyticus]|uniref:hypothetical protein n=1 Tax=Paenibacillus polysaccharolyticus TaxID=582692 RepID=UPI00203ACA1E|nr:hypothetical protein [Paenibacillus polysaccharolyticus]MCM3132942.1 hypothetical protein [Paenibacillus polysaccharolyticus]
MRPEVDDFIEVTSEAHPQNGLIGRVVAASLNKVTVNLYGSEVILSESHIRVRAKLGTRAHALLNLKSMMWDMDSLDDIGLYVLMDIALWMRDYDWCKEIYQRMVKAG